MHARVLDAEKRASSGATQLSQAFSDQERRLQELKVGRAVARLGPDVTPRRLTLARRCYARVQSARADADRAGLAEARALRRQKQLEARVHELQQQVRACTCLHVLRVAQHRCGIVTQPDTMSPYVPQYEQLQAFTGGASGGTLFLENGAATPAPQPR